MTYRILAVVMFVLSASRSLAATPDAEMDERAAWFSDARYGMFVHWGLSSVLAGSYRGERIDRGTHGNGLGEWIMFNAKIPVADYADYAKQFNPVKFDADAWVRLAKNAGMKYIVFTTKHHEGFAMFHSRVSGFNIVDATPFDRDPLKELAEACERHGLRLGLYYSQAQDWHHPGGAVRTEGVPMAGGDPAGGRWDAAQAGDFDKYLDELAAPQLRELLTRYGHISILWWDTPVGMTPERAARLAKLVELQPHLLTNNRLLNPRERNAFSGDTETPEQFIPATGFKDRLFEVCMTMNDTWGYKAHDQNWKPAEDITRKLIDIASKGGNFLLNVGPDAHGEIPAPSVERLRESGRWIQAHGESIYGTTASLFRRLPWGRSTTKGSIIYLHVFDWPSDGRLLVPGLKTPVRRAQVLGQADALRADLRADGVWLNVPARAPDPVASVVKLEFDSSPQVDQPLPAPDAKGVVHLPATVAAIVNAYDGNARVIGAGAEAFIGGWDREGTTLNWEFRTDEAARFVVEAEVASGGGGTLSLRVGDQKDETHLSAAGQMGEEGEFAFVTLAEVDVAAGEHALELRSEKGWSDTRLRGVRLVRLNRR